MDRTTDIFAPDIFALAERRMAWLDQRQATLAHNVANANTPGFRARDSAPFAAALSQAGGGQLALTLASPTHLAGTGSAPGSVGAHVRERTATGNTVALEDELSKVADTASKQDLTASLYRKYAGLYRTALGR